MRAARFHKVAALLLALGLTAPARAADDREAALARIEQARGLLNEGRTNEALAAFEEAARLDPANGGARNALGSLLNREGRYAEALPHAMAAVELEPGNARFRYNRGVVLSEHGRFAEAVADFDLALAAHPELAYAWLERGAAKLSLGRSDEARLDWAQARKAEPELIWTHWYPATADFVEGRFAAAAAGFDRVAAAEPEFVPARLWRVIARARAGGAFEPPAGGDGQWPAAVLNFYRGVLSAEGLIETAGQDRISGDRRRIGEAHFFIAHRALIAGRSRKAERHFRLALAVDSPRHVWKLSAERELARLGSQSSDRPWSD